jgi:heat-inducible transcriptional repressor
MKVLLVDKADKIDTLLKQIAKLLAANTNYATLVTKPQYRSRKVKFIQLTEVDDDQILAVILLEGNIVKNKIINTLEKLDKEIILKLNIVFNTFLQGLDLSEINLTIIQKMKEQAGSYSNVVSDILDAIAQAISEEKNVEIYTSGATNMLKYPELSDMDKVSELLNTFEEKNQLTELVASPPEEDAEKGGIQVYIGSETPVEAMKDCSVVTATYEIEDGVYGKIGIIGPKRMDYEKVVSTLHTLMVQLDEIFKKKT